MSERAFARGREPRPGLQPLLATPPRGWYEPLPPAPESRAWYGLPLEGRDPLLQFCREARVGLFDEPPAAALAGTSPMTTFTAGWISPMIALQGRALAAAVTDAAPADGAREGEPELDFRQGDRRG